jgi:hypothetical protein
MSTKQLLAQIERGVKALEKARTLILKAEGAASKGKATASKTAPKKATKAAKVPAKKSAAKATKGTKSPAKTPAKKAVKGGISEEGRARIAAATRKRWAKVRLEKKKAAKAAKAALVAPVVPAAE